MEKLVSSFEKEIQAIIRQKADSYKQEEKLLLRTFKFFDFQGEGFVEFSQFERVMIKLSITMLNSQELKEVFNYYILDQGDMSSRYGGLRPHQKLNYNIFVNKVLGLTRGKSVDDFEKRNEKAMNYGDTRLPIGNDEDIIMISSKDFERAIEDLRNGIKRMDMMYFLNKINKRMGKMRGQRELDQREIQQEFMENGLDSRHQV